MLHSVGCSCREQPQISSFSKCSGLSGPLGLSQTCVQHYTALLKYFLKRLILFTSPPPLNFSRVVHGSYKNGCFTLRTFMDFKRFTKKITKNYKNLFFILNLFGEYIRPQKLLSLIFM